MHETLCVTRAFHDDFKRGADRGENLHIQAVVMATQQVPAAI